MKSNPSQFVASSGITKHRLFFLFLFRTDKKIHLFRRPDEKNSRAESLLSAHDSKNFHGASSAALSHPAGSFTVKVTPRASLAATAMLPPCASTIFLQM
jgi:hypothetical protein